MTCPKCGKENRDDPSLCVQGGAPLAKQEAQVPKESSEGGSWKRVGIGFVIVAAVLTLSVVIRSLIDTTPPQVETYDATGVAANQATLNGDLIRRGETSPVYVSFQWGTSSHSYSNETEAEARETAGSFSSDLTGLNPSTHYYYRAKAVGNGTKYGCEQHFKTSRLVTNNASDMMLTSDDS